MPFIYKDRNRKEAKISGVFKIPDYTKIEPIPELRKKIKEEAKKGQY